MIRLQRVGKKNQAMFRLVLTDKQNGPKSGRFKELLGSYNPHSNEVQFNTEKIKYWIENGAQLSDTVHNLLISRKVISGDKKNVLPRKTPIKKEEDDAVEKAPEAAEVAPVKEADTTKEDPTSAEAESESLPESVGKETKAEESKSAEEVAEPVQVEEKSPEKPNEEESAEEQENKKESAK